ncbi:transcriptional regulator, LacI family [Terriglobus saanensis SP1PR4]|uniref:Transcriptional regulator, LacI family n=2 Tax=Terriglobus saanensis TaxID=870903 RepID=E8UX98_TERSS|nr:transcriptional regulator, LacI family [Terriglobus saanensis SP1PR4]
MHDIASRADVSLGTVSHVINGTAPVRDVLKKRVLQAIDDLGYQPNHLSRGLRRNQTNLIGMIIPDIMNPFFPSVVRGVEDMAYKASYRLLLCNADNDVQKETAYLNDLRSFLPAGIILIPSLDHKIASQGAGPPVVCMDRVPKGWKGDSVTVANEAGGHAAAEHLIEMGHKIIGIVRGPSNVVTAEERVTGFVKAMKAARLSISPEYIQEGQFDRESGYTCTLRLLNMLPRPTAIFTASDLMATGALAAIKASKLKCPDDISIVSFDGLAFTELTEPALTSIFQPSYQLGYTAARLLLDRINGEDFPPQNVMLDTELKIRDSVRRI